MAFDISTPGTPAVQPAHGADLLRQAETARQARLGSLLARAGSAADKRYKSDRALHLTDEGDVVEEGDARGRFLLVGKGGSIPQDLADELHLGPKASAAEAADAPATTAPAAPVAPAQAPAAPVAAPGQAVDALPLSDAQKAAIAAAGYDSRAKLAAATDEQLKAIPGIGDASIAKLRDLYPAQ